MRIVTNSPKNIPDRYTPPRRKATPFNTRLPVEVGIIFTPLPRASDSHCMCLYTGFD